MTSESQPLVWANGDQTSEGVIVDTDGNEALLELHNGEYDVRLVKDLKAVGEPEVPEVETLTCQAGQHEWTRPKGGRGRKPLNCPEHQPTVDHEPEVQTLTCKAGHEWTRTAQRGALPQWCPDHKPQAQRPAEARTEAHSTPSATNGANGTNGNGTTGKVKPEALAILAGRTMQELAQAHDELGLKLAYVVETLVHPGERESGEINMLLQRQKELIHEHSRMHRHA